MGRKKIRKKTTQKQKAKDIDLSVILMIVVAILLFVLIYGEKGAIGANLSPVLGGIIGPIKYIIPFGFIGIAIVLIKEKRNFLASKIIQYIIFLGCIASILTIYQVSKGTINIDDIEFNKMLETSYSLGEKSIGGGTVGATIAYPLIRLLGMFGAAILSGGIAACLLVFTFGIRPSKIYLDLSDKLDQMREEREDELERLRQRREERKERYQEEDDELPLKGRIRKNNKNNIQENSLTEDQITINLNNEKISEEKINSNGVFGKKNDQYAKDEKETINPNEIESNLFKQEEEKKENKIKEVLQLEHSTIMQDDEDYEFPPVELLQQSKGKAMKGGKKVLTDTATKLQKTLYSFGVSAKVENVSVGPAITRYELRPAEGVRVSKIAKLADDIALNLAAESIRIEAPIPGKQAVGIEIPNKEKEVVHFRDVIESDEFEDAKSKLSMGLRKRCCWRYCNCRYC